MYEASGLAPDNVPVERVVSHPGSTARLIFLDPLELLGGSTGGIPALIWLLSRRPAVYHTSPQ